MLVTFTTLAPLAHSAFGPSIGNATAFRRFRIGDAEVPAVSGNALRGIMRRIVMRDLFDRCGLNVESPGWDALYAALANGGHLQGSETSLDPVYVRDLRSAVPGLSVFGSALRTWMLSGRMSVGILWPDCAEVHAAGLCDPNGIAAEDLIEEVSHVRHVDRDQQNPETTGVTPMPTTIEAMKTGTVLRSKIIFDGNATETERSVIAWAIEQIHALGGKSSVGLGRVRIETAGNASPSSLYRDLWRQNPNTICSATESLQHLAGKLSGSAKKE
jgi:hypothetical protein